MKHFGLILIVLMSFGLSNCKKDKVEVPPVIPPVIDVAKSFIINELMAKNKQFGSDQNGQFDDWIELYNLSSEELDISGYYLTDSKKNLTKWKFPVGTKLAKNGYLIVWADSDTLQVGLHANFKLSSLGENVVLLSPDLTLINEVKFPLADALHSYGRIPNGTGSFIETTPTFNAENK